MLDRLSTGAIRARSSSGTRRWLASLRRSGEVRDRLLFHRGGHPVDRLLCSSGTPGSGIRVYEKNRDFAGRRMSGTQPLFPLLETAGDGQPPPRSKRRFGHKELALLRLWHLWNLRISRAHAVRTGASGDCAGGRSARVRCSSHDDRNCWHNCQPGGALALKTRRV
jgi:hypothetical protein